MKWIAFGKYRLTVPTVIFLALVVLDAIQIAVGSGGMMLSIILAVWGLSWGLWRLSHQFRARLTWKVRNRLIVTYVFIAVVPLTLAGALTFIAGYAFMGRTAAYLLETALERRNLELEKAARLLATEAPASRLSTAQYLTATGMPDFEILVTGDEEFRYPAGSRLQMPPAGWRDYTGIVHKNGRHYLMSLATRRKNQTLILRSLTPEDQANLVPGLGVLKLPRPNRASDPDFNRTSVSVQGGSIVSGAPAGVVPSAQNIFDLEVDWLATIQWANWGRPNSQTASVAGVVTRPSALLAILFPSDAGNSDWLMYAIYGTGVLLCLAWVASLYVGISMTRTFTGAVHNLHEGTTTIGEGNFVHRIPTQGHDQLADLGRSFNKMAGQLGQFVVVTKEKERLQSEIAIASEVQTRLFPHKPPSAKTIEMLGVCHAARSVSGDYYDYFTAASGELALALGDVAGKGISAALLMASIQSIMRTQLFDGGAILSPSATVARLNRLLYATTSPEKYATFFFGLYNEDTRQFTYTNAGHLPPLLIQRDGYRLLEVTGSVVGAFPSLRYEEQTIAMEPGDLLVAYTDGISEPENDYGEEFGADRLAEVIMLHRDAAPEKIVEKVLEAVRDWDVASEQADDMTLMIVRSLA